MLSIPTHTTKTQQKKRRAIPYWTIFFSPAMAVHVVFCKACYNQHKLTPMPGPINVSYFWIFMAFRTKPSVTCVSIRVKNPALMKQMHRKQGEQGLVQVCRIVTGKTGSWMDKCSAPLLVQKVSWDSSPADRKTDTGGPMRGYGLET